MIPIILSKIKDFLIQQKIQFPIKKGDGRVESVKHEKIICDLLKKEYGDEVKIMPNRFWYDIAVRDEDSWLPVNIKSTTMKSSDSVGNIALCLYSFTNVEMNLRKAYHNDAVTRSAFIHAIQEKQFNDDWERDYYFLVINKSDTSDIIVNSLRGASNWTLNNSSFPFQIKWSKNRDFKPPSEDAKEASKICCRKIGEAMLKLKSSMEVSLYRDSFKVLGATGVIENSIIEDEIEALNKRIEDLKLMKC